MSKRFISTEILDDAWVCDLPMKYKVFWLYLITKCNHAGIWEVNWRNANFYVGDHLEPIEAERYLKDRIVKIKDGKYWFIPKFITFQYKELSKYNNAHKLILETIEKYNLYNYLTDITFKEMNEPLLSPSSGAQDKDKDKDKVKDKVMVKDKEKESKKKEKFVFDFVDNEILNEYMEYYEFRKEIKAPFKTQNGIIQNYNKLLTLSNSNFDVAKKILRQSIDNEWQGLFELKTNNSNERNKTNTGNNTKSDFRDNFVETLENSYKINPDLWIKNSGDTESDTVF